MPTIRNVPPRRGCRLAARAAAAAAALHGCGPQGPGPPTPATAWRDGPFVPVRARIHPLTRIVAEPGERRIDVHLELYDYWDHSVKGIGTVLFELYLERTLGSGQSSASQEMRWPVIDILDPEANSRTYDPVTRTYLVTLTEVPEELPPGRLLLLATFTTAGGERLPTARHVVE